MGGAFVLFFEALLFGEAFASPETSNETTFFREEFISLERWKALHFPKISKHSKYDIVKDGEASLLRLQSNASASALVLKNSFDVNKTPVVRWRWKVENVYDKGDGTKKEGDDYPVRIYVIFQYNPKKGGVLSRTKYKMAKLLYGEYPPDSTISFVWANRRHNEKSITSPYTDRAKVVPLNFGTNGLNEWQEQSVNIVSWYKEAFGGPPPKEATLAVMNDSDNTGELSVSYIDFIEISN